MSAPPRQRKKSRRLPAAVLAAAVLFAGLAAWWFASPGVSIPTVETGDMEPQVAALIKDSVAVVRKEPGSESAWGKLAQVYHAHDLYAPALECYRQAMALAPRSFRWQYLAAHAQSKINQEDAVALFEAARGLAPAREEVSIALADALLALGRHEEARSAYADALKSNPESPFAYIGLARLALLSNEPGEAIAHLVKAGEISPENGEVHTLLAQLYLRQGEQEKARDSERLASIHDKTLRPADPVLQAMEDLAVNSRAYTLRGVRLSEQGKFKAAETQFRKVLSIRPGVAQDYSNLASALLRQGRLEEALAEFEKAQALDPDDVETLSNFGLALLQSGQTARAGETLLAALRADPNHAPAHLNLGLLRENEGRTGDAGTAYRKAIELDPGLADAYLNLGTLQARDGDLVAAIEAWETFASLRPGDPAAIYNIGQAYRMLGRHRQAADNFRKGLAIAPNSSRFVFALAWELATAPEPALREGRQALDLASRLVAAQPRDPAIMDLQAAALAESGDFAQAAATAERALQAAAGNPALASGISERLALYRAGQPYRQQAREEAASDEN